MDTHKNKAYSLRINSSLMEKIKIIADEDSRSVNKLITLILEKHVLEYEYKHGIIEINQHDSDGR